VAPALAEVVMRAIQKSPRDRYQSADEFRKALTPYLGADHARLQALADASGRANTTNPGTHPSGEIRSGIVRSGHVQVAASTMAQTSGGIGPNSYPSGVNAPQAQSFPGYPSAPGYGSSPGYASAPGYAPVAPLPFAPQPIAQPAPSRPAWILPFAIVLAAICVAGGIFFSRVQTTTPPPAPHTQAATPTPTPSPAVMVTVTTRPSGAQVRSRAGAVLCESTPCAIPIPSGAPTPVRVVLQSATIDATLDPGSPSASIDLTALLAPSAPQQTPVVPVAAQTADAGVRRIERRHGTTARPPQGETGTDLPMFLPH
jgi:hypothetical protein